MNRSICCRLIALAMLIFDPFAIADHEDNLISVHDDNITLVNDLIVIGGQSGNGRCGQADCPSIASLSSVGKGTSKAVGALGGRIDQARGSSNKQFSIISRLPKKGGSAGADSGDFSPWSPFLVADTSDTDHRQTERTQAYNQDTHIGMLGMDFRARRNLIIGATVNHMRSETVIAEQGGSADSDTNILGIHTSSYWGNTFVDGLITHGEIDIDLVRNSSTGSYATETEGKFHSAEVTVGHFFGSEQVTLTPSLRAFHIRGELDDFEETALIGGGGALAYNTQHFESLNLRAALQFDYVFLTDFGTVTPRLYVAYYHEFSDAQAAGTKSGLKQFSDKPEQNYGAARFSLALQLPRGVAAFVSLERAFEHYQMDQESLALGCRVEL
ncbi:uncharacterized protein YhjY with autotransporter beta-barrel domain [Litorivivens lipolytica]|uniref:Uncharacterized protein YhjY with autotransporter beta-barrel domain n=1 Tax=Litorivivens lipolytica TaxID=1524264 RepID=A0A7W4W2T3_9GAMM|nr:autotransporter outer membrane beta-barrel domain-containing protein [Litorivivens lipolytica]MBB3046275.1 uncharacterized protein YhjY with autotransporter beta-barrel domain [Litorivivens lipolytica]